MLSFRINNEDMDLLPGTQMEMEENNPFLQFGEELPAEYSLPIEVPNTPKNNRLLSYAGVFQRVNENPGIEALAFDNGFQHSSGKLKLEKVQHNLNRAAGGRLSLYYLTGTSNFSNAIKNKRLREVDFGGARTFSWDNYNVAGNGFWGHIHKVANAAPGAYDYAFYPARMSGFTLNSVDVPMVNWMGRKMVVSNVLQFESFNPTLKDANAIVPFVYLKVVLQRIFSHIGWKLEGEILSDEQFQKITVVNTRCIDWAISQRYGLFPPKARSFITFNLQDHIPNVTISEFLAVCRKRFAWWYDVDRANKVVRIKELASVAMTDVKDLTAKASPLVPKTVLGEKKIYSLRNTSSSSAANLDGLEYKGEVATVANLPSPAEERDNHVYLIRSYNNYAICRQHPDSGAWLWEHYEGNTGDVVPAGATDEIPGNSTVPVLARISVENVTYLLPEISGGGYWPGRTDDNQGAEIQFCFYYGRRQTEQNYSCPFASHHIYDAKNQQVGAWSLSYLGKDLAGNDVGLYERKWRVFLERLIAKEEVEVTLTLSRAEFMAMKYSDVINVAGVQMYVKKRKYMLPYRGSVVVTCSRI